jgi:hypothetical protein
LNYPVHYTLRNRNDQEKLVVLFVLCKKIMKLRSARLSSRRRDEKTGAYSLHNEMRSGNVGRELVKTLPPAGGNC